MANWNNKLTKAIYCHCSVLYKKRIHWHCEKQSYNTFEKGHGLKGTNRALRGGSWNNNAESCRVVNRNNNAPTNRNNNIGFRLTAQWEMSDMTDYWTNHVLVRWRYLWCTTANRLVTTPLSRLNGILSSKMGVVFLFVIIGASGLQPAIEKQNPNPSEVQNLRRVGEKKWQPIIF